VRGIRDEAAGVAQDEPDVRILAANTIAYQKVCCARGVQEEVGREWRHAGHCRAGQIGRVDKDHRRTSVERREQVVLAVLAEVGACVVGQQHDPVGLEIVESADALGHGFVHVGHRNGGEETEPVRRRRDQVGAVVVEVAGQCGGVCGVGQERRARRGHREDRGGHAEVGHRLQGALRAPVGQGTSTGFIDACATQHVSVVGRDHVVVGVNSQHRCPSCSFG
jgi:hypothetical protein